MTNDEKLKTKEVAHAVGRRKRSVATVKLLSGTGEITVNGHPAVEYFPGISAKVNLDKPFTVCSVTKYSATAKVSGGGKLGQLDALVLGISRCLANVKAEYKLALKNAGLLTRDSRRRQRRMVGMGGKSRRKRQSPKR
jgi:small subunit ribosomal protein S9